MHLHNERKLSASSVNVALRCFYGQVLERSIAEVERSLPQPVKPNRRESIVSRRSLLLDRGCLQPTGPF